MSKRCSKCGATNFDSATLCVNCGSLFKDGAYSPNASKARKFKMPYKEAISLEKSTKAIVAVIVSIIVILIAITIGCIIAFSGGKSAGDIDDIQENAEVAQQIEAADAQGKKSVASANSGSYSGSLGSDSGDSGVYVNSITAAEKNVELKIGDIKELSVSLFPENTDSKYVTWYCDNENVVRFVKQTKDVVCNVEAVGEGTATITIQAVGNGLAIVSETITVTVVDANKLVQPEQFVDYGDYSVTANTYLSLRTGPDADFYGEIDRMNRDTVVRVYAKQTNDKGDWWYYVDFNGEEGWALGRYLQEYQYEEVEDYYE